MLLLLQIGWLESIMKWQSCQFEFNIVVWVSDFRKTFNNKTKRISPQNSKQASIKTQSEQTIYFHKKKTPLA